MGWNIEGEIEANYLVPREAIDELSVEITRPIAWPVWQAEFLADGSSIATTTTSGRLSRAAHTKQPMQLRSSSTSGTRGSEVAKLPSSPMQ
jgi:hypothetical protein